MSEIRARSVIKTRAFLSVMKKYFLDTCIWRDFYEDRIGFFGKPLGDLAAALIIKITKTKNTILFSETLFWELKKDYSLIEIKNMLNFLFISRVLIKVEITKEEYAEAKILAEKKNVPFVDCLNAVQARNHEAIMISRDKHFFENLSNIVETKKPEDII